MTATGPLDADSAGKIVFQGLRAAADVHNRLGIAGQEKVGGNRFGDISLRADVEIERAVIGVLQANGVRAHIVSEESGDFNLSAGRPSCTAILDGLDGSSVYSEARGRGRYGTMFALYQGTDPYFKDYLAAGIMIHSPAPELILAIRGQGVARMDAGGEPIPVGVRNTKTFDPTTSHVYLDEGVPENLKTYAPFTRVTNTHFLRSSATYYADLACGRTDVVLECTRKRNLEIGVAYGVINEAGGVMVDKTGASIAGQRFLAWEQKRHAPVLSATSQSVADGVRSSCDAVARSAGSTVGDIDSAGKPLSSG